MPVLFSTSAWLPLTVPSSVMPPAPELNVASPVNVVEPRFIWVFVVATVPAMFTVVGLLALPVVASPPAKVMLSASSSPNVTVPVFKKLVSLVIAPPALNATSWPRPNVTRLFAVTDPLNATDPVAPGSSACNVSVERLSWLPHCACERSRAASGDQLQWIGLAPNAVGGPGDRDVPADSRARRERDRGVATSIGPDPDVVVDRDVLAGGRDVGGQIRRGPTAIQAHRCITRPREVPGHRDRAA